MEAYFKPAPIIMAEQFHFHKSGEAIANFVADLRRLATNCKFGAYLDDALWDRFVCSLSNETIQRRVLVEKELTMTKAVDLATSLLSAEKNSQAMHLSEGGVRALKTSVQQPCYHCGKKGHNSSQCRFKDAAVCDACGKIGHIAPASLKRKEG